MLSRGLLMQSSRKGYRGQGIGEAARRRRIAATAMTIEKPIRMNQPATASGVDVSRLRAFPNVHLLGRKEYGELPGYCKGFDVALMPFKWNELTLNANPLKVREYLAAGLPCVSTPLPEVVSLGLCKLAATPTEFVRKVDECLREGAGPTRERARRIVHEGWEARVEEIVSATSEGRRIVVSGLVPLEGERAVDIARARLVVPPDPPAPVLCWSVNPQPTKPPANRKREVTTASRTSKRAPCLLVILGTPAEFGSLTHTRNH